MVSHGAVLSQLSHLLSWIPADMASQGTEPGAHWLRAALSVCACVRFCSHLRIWVYVCHLTCAPQDEGLLLLILK